MYVTHLSPPPSTPPPPPLRCQWWRDEKGTRFFSPHPRTPRDSNVRKRASWSNTFETTGGASSIRTRSSPHSVVVLLGVFFFFLFHSFLTKLKNVWIKFNSSIWIFHIFLCYFFIFSQKYRELEQRNNL